MNHIRISTYCMLLFFSSLSWSLRAQEGLLDELEQMQPQEKEYVTAAFKSTRVVNGHSIEILAPGALEFRIAHRFGALNGGAYNLWGLDQASMRIGLDYGLTNWLMFGAGRSTYQKTYDGFVKLRLLRQSKGVNAMPVSLLYFGSTSVNSLKWEDPERNNYFSSRLAFVHQIIIGRKFNENFSMQLSPTLVHKNLVSGALTPNDSYALGMAGRYKVGKRVALSGEYYYRIPSNKDPAFDDYYNSLSVGVDIETGGHVFQFHLTNALPMVEKGFITETNESWTDKGIHLGFNITREFTTNAKKRKDW